MIALAAVVFSIPAGAEINETQCGGGGNGTYPLGWNETPTPVVIVTAVPEPTPWVSQTPVEVEPDCNVMNEVWIRGEVVDAATQIAPFTWTGQNFAGLYYDVGRNLMSDSLTSTVTVPDTIESGDLAYTAHRVESCYANPEIGEYFAIGWFGERYMAVNGKPYLVSPIIFEMGEGCKKTLSVGDEWDLGNGYFLVVVWIDLDANKVLLSLFEDGAEVASSVIQPHESGDWFGNCMDISGFPGAYDAMMWNAPTTSTFVYQEDMGLEAAVPIFSVYVDAIFRGTDANIAQLKYAMLIDDDPVRVIDEGADVMEVEMVTPESVRLVNSENINLHRDSDIVIAEDLLIHVADDRDGNGVANYRYHPYVRRAGSAPDPGPTPTPTPTPYPVDGVDEIQIRGEVVEPVSVQTDDIVWDASNFAAFWYDPDDDLMTETLTIAAGALSMYDQTIEEQEIEFDCSEWGMYNVTGFMGETYFTGYGANTSDRITDETVSLVSKNMLCKVLIDEGNEHTISTGASLELPEGYELKIVQLDVGVGKAHIELLRNGKSVDTSIINMPATYVYKRDIGTADDVPLIIIHVNSAFASIECDILTIKGLFQISEDYICDRTIEEHRIEYVTETMEIDFDYIGWGEYDAMSFMAETYCTGFDTNTAKDITGDTISLVSNDMLCKVLIDENDKHCIPLGTSLELHEGYALKLIQLDVDGNLAQIELLRNGNRVDTDILSNTETYVYRRDLGTVDDVPLIVIHIDSIIASTELDMIVIDGIFQISGDCISVKPGDNYGEMEIVSTSSGMIRMGNYDDIDLSDGETIDLMGCIKLIVADNETLRFAPVAELTDPGTYEVRGAVQSPDGNQSSEIVWNASNFAFFWYDIDSDASTETLKIAPGTLSELDRTIDEGDLVYATHPIYREYELYEGEERTVDGHEGYLVGGWVGQQCVAINGSADKLCELLTEFEDDDKKTLATGEPWDIGGGFTLTARQINLEGDKVWFSLYKDGKEIDSELILCSRGEDHWGRVYTYTADIGGEDDVPIFTCYVDAIFRGTDSNIVQVMYVFLIDDGVLELGTGDRFDCMEVVTVSSADVILRNSETIDLDAGTTRMIMDDMYFRIADDDVLRSYPFVKRTISDEPGDYDGGSGTYPPGEGCTINDSDGDGVPDPWDKEPDTPQGYLVNSNGIGRRWGDMNGDGKLTSADALTLLQAAAEKIDMG